MRLEKSDRGFMLLLHETYAEKSEEARLISESSAVGDYEDSYDKPGSSYLWVGNNHHLNREEVKQLIACMQYWLDKKRLPSRIPK